MYGYLPDPCDCAAFYQCDSDGQSWTAHRHLCPPCMGWDQSILSCSIKLSDDCKEEQEEYKPDIVQQDAGRFLSLIAVY